MYKSYVILYILYQRIGPNIDASFFHLSKIESFAPPIFASQRYGNSVELGELTREISVSWLANSALGMIGPVDVFPPFMKIKQGWIGVSMNSLQSKINLLYTGCWCHQLKANGLRGRAENWLGPIGHELPSRKHQKERNLRTIKFLRKCWFREGVTFIYTLNLDIFGSKPQTQDAIVANILSWWGLHPGIPPKKMVVGRQLSFWNGNFSGVNC